MRLVIKGFEPMPTTTGNVAYLQITGSKVWRPFDAYRRWTIIANIVPL